VSKYDEPCPSCGILVHPTDEDAHLRECWPAESKRLRNEVRGHIAEHGLDALTIARLRTENAALREALADATMARRQHGCCDWSCPLCETSCALLANTDTEGT
jgi:hypothetical protein